jgi:hypothetical protein
VNVARWRKVVVVVVRYLWQVSRVGSRVKIAVACCSIQGEALYAERDLMVVMIIIPTRKS